MPRRRGKHVGEAPEGLRWADDDGSFAAALVVAGALGAGIVAVVSTAILL